MRAEELTDAASGSNCVFVSDDLLTNAPMARPRLISDEQILEATRRCVLERGPHVSLDVIAEQLGVTGPALLRRFRNREELFIRALMPDRNPEWMQEFDKGPDDRPLEVQLREHLARVWKFFEEVIPRITALRESGIEHKKVFDNDEGPAQAVRAITGWFKRAIEMGLVEAEEAETLTYAFMGALQYRAFISYMVKSPNTARSNREFLDDVARFFCRALKPAAAAKTQIVKRKRTA